MMSLNKNVKYGILIIFVSGFFSCNIFKKNVKKPEKSENLKISKITKNVKSEALQFQTFSAGFYGTYSDKKQKLPLKGIIKIKKDTFIWITLRPFMGIELARILLTTDSIKYIDKINNNYFEENYDYLKNKYGFSFNYKIIESCLTNKIFTYPISEKIENYSFSENDSLFLLQNEYTEYSIKYNHLLNINRDYYLKKNKLALTDNSNFAEFNYSEFKQLNSKMFPYKIIINFKNNNTTGSAVLNYKNIIPDKNISAKFVIPKHYKRINFE